jgi:putative FmdB family regulatory protein
VPLYEYECRKCHHRFEVIQSVSDKPIRKCPNCKKGTVQKLLSSPALRFKGSGWYVTDYARKGKNGGDSEAPKESTEKPDKKESTTKAEAPAKESSKKSGGKSGKSGD